MPHPNILEFVLGLVMEGAPRRRQAVPLGLQAKVSFLHSTIHILLNFVDPRALAKPKQDTCRCRLVSGRYLSVSTLTVLTSSSSVTCARLFQLRDIPVPESLRHKLVIFGKHDNDWDVSDDILEVVEEVLLRCSEGTALVLARDAIPNSQGC